VIPKLVFLRWSPGVRITLASKERAGENVAMLPGEGTRYEATVMPGEYRLHVGGWVTDVEVPPGRIPFDLGEDLS